MQAPHLSPFDIPHILAAISQDLTSSDLFHCCLVNHAWSQYFTPLAWRTLTVTSTKFRAFQSSSPHIHTALAKNSAYLCHLSVSFSSGILDYLGRNCTRLQSLHFDCSSSDGPILTRFLNALPVGPLHRINLYLPPYKDPSIKALFSSLERHAPTLQDVELVFSFRDGPCPLIQYLLSHAPNLKRIKVRAANSSVSDRAPGGLMYIMAEDILKGEPWVCDGIQEMVFGIRGIQRTRELYEDVEPGQVQYMDMSSEDGGSYYDGSEDGSSEDEDQYREWSPEDDQDEQETDSGHDEYPMERNHDDDDQDLEPRSPQEITASLTQSRQHQRQLLTQITPHFSHLRRWTLGTSSCTSYSDSFEFSLEAGLDILLQSCPALQEWTLLGLQLWISCSEIRAMAQVWPQSLRRLEGLENCQVRFNRVSGLNRLAAETWPGIRLEL